MLPMSKTAMRKLASSWANEKSAPSGETIVEIVRALKILHPLAAKAFVERYLGEEIKDL
jgi:hypothetical protein